MKTELRNATWESNQLIDKYFPFDAEQATKVMQALVDKNIIAVLEEDDTVCLQYKIKSVHHPWPKTKYEKEYYMPFVGLLNDIRFSFRQRKKKYDVIFFQKQGPLDTIEGSSAAIKPDGLGWLKAKEPSDRISWGEVEIAIEIKDNWSDLIAQAATYARAILASSSRRFALIIAFNHIDKCARFCLYHRSGMYATEALNLEKKSSFKIFISGVVGVLSSDIYAAGRDKSRLEDFFSIPFIGVCRIVSILCNREVVRGRATFACSLERVIEEKDVNEELLESKVIAYNLRRRSGIARPRPRADDLPLTTNGNTEVELWNQFLANIEVEEGDIGDKWAFLEGEQLLDNFIVKDSWPLAGREHHEGQMFEAAMGDFGLPVIIGSYVVNGGRDDMNLPNNAKYWDVFNTGESPEPVPESRKHVRTLIKTEGVSLLSSKGPKELLQSVCHAILGKSPSVFLTSFLIEEPLSLGHWNLFKRGWLHRDVSIGNVLGLKTPEVRKPVIE